MFICVGFGIEFGVNLVDAITNKICQSTTRWIVTLKLSWELNFNYSEMMIHVARSRIYGVHNIC